MIKIYLNFHLDLFQQKIAKKLKITVLVLEKLAQLENPDDPVGQFAKGTKFAYLQEDLEFWYLF